MYQQKIKQKTVNSETNKTKSSNPSPQILNPIRDVRIQYSCCPQLQKTSNVTSVIQKEDWRTRSLQHESGDAGMPETLTNHKKIHHTLPRKKLKEFNATLKLQDLIRILEIFGREFASSNVCLCPQFGTDKKGEKYLLLNLKQIRHEYG